MNVNFGHHRGVSAWDREGKGVCHERQIIKYGFRTNGFGSFQIYWLQGLRWVRKG